MPAPLYHLPLWCPSKKQNIPKRQFFLQNSSKIFNFLLQTADFQALWVQEQLLPFFYYINLGA